VKIINPKITRYLSFILMRTIQLMKKMSDARQNIFHVYHIRIIAKKNWFTRHETDRFLNNHCQECVRAYLSIHDCLSFLHEVTIGNHRTNLEYGSTFTKLFMHVSSRNMFPTTRNLQIRVHFYRPRHCCGDGLTFGCFVPMIWTGWLLQNILFSNDNHATI
jgi:hypothetical protein